MKKLLFILGTRPEAIKLSPIIKLASKYFQVAVCLTNQHSDLANYFLDVEIIQLDLIRNDSDLTGLTGQILTLLDQNRLLKTWSPDLILVHGDTCSALCGALYAFYSHTQLCHIESGLRTQDKKSPFPEESNRKLIDYLSDIYFAPTELDKKNLNKENITNNVFVVGNSIIDVIKNYTTDDILIGTNKPYVLVTLHRRENWGEKIKSALLELSKFASTYFYNIIYVCNKNATLKNQIQHILGQNSYIKIHEPMDHHNFYQLIYNSEVVLTDSGGLQEEAVFLKKPLLIMRDSTERQDIINNGCGYLVGPHQVYTALIETITGKLRFNAHPYLYGQGDTSESIVKILYENFLH